MKLFQQSRIGRPLAGLLIGVLVLLSLASCNADTATTGSTATATVSASSTPGATATSVLPTPTVQATPVPPQTHATPCAKQAGLISIRMLTHTQGWALNQYAILRTSDGGLHWSCVTPSNVEPGMRAVGAYLIDNKTAWVIPTPANGSNTLTVLHTTNGGQSWQSSTITDDQPQVIEPPHFLSASVGFLEVVNHGGPGAGSESVDIFKSTDGGASWSKLASSDDSASGLSRGGIKSGISFEDTQNGWATGEDASDIPWLYVSHDGGKTWTRQAIPGISTITQNNFVYVHATTTPPVFFGTTGLLPVHVTAQLSNGTVVNGFVLYTSQDGGNTWTSTWLTKGNVGALTTFDTSNNGLYIATPDHAWAGNINDGSFYRTVNAGASWIKVASGLGQMYSISFVDNSYGWVLGNKGLFGTTDGGTTLQPIAYQYI